MQQVYGYSPMRAGFAYVPLAVSVAAGAGIASSLIAKMAARPVLITGLVITVTGLLLIWRAPADGSYAVDLLAPFLALGLGCGMVYVTLQIAAFVGISEAAAGVGARLTTPARRPVGRSGSPSSRPSPTAGSPPGWLLPAVTSSCCGMLRRRPTIVRSWPPPASASSRCSSRRS